MNPARLIGLCIALILLIPGAAVASVPGASTGEATDITSNGATLNGVVNPNKEDTTYAFEYGTTTTYGTKTADGTASGNAGKDAAAAITGLAPSTVYHFRLVATNTSGTDVGGDKIFTTLASMYVLPPGPSAVTLAATPTTITLGATTTLSGRLTGPDNAAARVQLQESPVPATDFKNVGDPVVTDAAGNYSFTVAPALNTRYQVVAKASPPVTSAAVLLLVRSKVSFKVGDSLVHRGQRVRFKGTVKPAHDGRRVKIQRRTKTGFKTVARATLRKSATVGRSAYNKRIRIKAKGTYRVRLGADADHATGTSRKRTIRIR